MDYLLVFYILLHAYCKIIFMKEMYLVDMVSFVIIN